jgi:hypothetical protein
MFLDRIGCEISASKMAILIFQDGFETLKLQVPQQMVSLSNITDTSDHSEVYYHGRKACGVF